MTTNHITQDSAVNLDAPARGEWPFRRPAARRYGAAALAILLAFCMRYVIYGDLSNRLTFTFFVPAAMVAAWYGGLGPGMLATIFGLFLGSIFFIPLTHTTALTFSMRETMAVVGYGVTTMLCVALCENLHHYIRHLERLLEYDRHHPSHQEPLNVSLFPGWPFRRPALARYGYSVLAVLVAFGLRYWLFGTDDHRFPFLFFVPAAIIATWYGGMALGLIATTAGLMLGDFFFLSQHEAMGAVRESERLATGLYAVTTMLCVILFESLHNRVRRLEHAIDHARQHNNKLLSQEPDPGLSHLA